ncbi:MAG: hypothetical protein ABFD07_17360 [Methanobacterium sp.]
MISIMFGQNSEYWNSNLINDECTTKNIESAEGFESEEQAKKVLEQTVKPLGIEKGWNVSYSIEEL